MAAKTNALEILISMCSQCACMCSALHDAHSCDPSDSPSGNVVGGYDLPCLIVYELDLVETPSFQLSSKDGSGQCGSIYTHEAIGAQEREECTQVQQPYIVVDPRAVVVKTSNTPAERAGEIF